MLFERQRQEQAERVAIFESGGKPKKRGRKRRAFSVVVLLLLVVGFFLPQLVGVFGKGIVESRASAAIGADVRIQRLGLSWFGSQRVTGLRVVDGSLREAADVDIKASKSLIRLLTDWKSFGTVTVSGSVLLDQTDGPLAEILGGKAKPAEDASPGGLRMDLYGKVVLDGLAVRYRSDAVDIAADGVVGSMSIDGGAGIDVAISSPKVVRDGVESEVELNAAIGSYLDSSGELDIQKSTITGTLKIASDRSPVGLVLGDGFSVGRSELLVEFEGGLGRGTARVAHGTPESAVELPLAYRLGDGAYVLEVAKGGSAEFGSALTAALLPEIAEYVGQEIVLESGRVVVLSELPGVSVWIDELSVEVPMSGGFDLGALVARLTIETGELRGLLDGEAWLVEPMAVDISTRGVRRGVRVEAVTTAQLAGRPAGIFVLNAEVEDLFDEAGVLPSGADGVVQALLAGLRGGFEVNDVQTALIESVIGPLLTSAGVVLGEDLGKTVAAEVSFSGGAQQVARVWITSDNLQFGGGFVIDDGVIRTDGAGVRAQAVSMAPLLSRQVDIPGLELTSGGGGELWVRDLAVDFGRLAGDGAVDWRAVSGFVELRLGPMFGTILDQEEIKEIETSASAVSVDLLDVQAGASVAMGMSVRVADEPAGELSVSLLAQDLVGNSGALIAGVPTVEGEVSLRGAMTRLAQPMVEAYGFVLEDDFGPTVDVVAQASVDAEGVVTVDVSVAADRVTGLAKLLIQDRVVRATGDGIKIEVRRVGDLIARWLPDGLTPMQGGGLRVSSDDLVIAMGDGGIDWSRSQVNGNIHVLGLEVVDTDGRRYAIERFDCEVALGSRADGALAFSTVFLQRGEPVLAAGQFSFVGIIEKRRMALDRVRLDGQLDTTGFPISAATDAVDMGAQDVRSLAAELVGRLMDVSVIADAESGEIVMSVTGDRLTGSARAEFAGGDLRVLSAEFESVVGPEVIEQIRMRSAQAAGKTEPTGVRFIKPARVEFEVGEFGVLDGWAFAPSGSPSVKLTASGNVEGVRMERAGEVVGSGAIGVAPLVIEGDVPIGSILGGESAQASLAVSGAFVSGDVPVAMITGGIDVGFVAGEIDGPMRADLKIAGLDCGQVDEIAHFDGIVAGIVGGRLGVDLSVTGQMTGGEVSEFAGELSIKSPRLRTQSPIRIKSDTESVWLLEPAVVEWQIETGTATHRLLAQPVGAERIYSVLPIDAVLRVDELRLSRKQGVFAPGVFALRGMLEAPTVRVRVPGESGDDPAGKLHGYSGLSLGVVGDASRIEIAGRAMPDDGRAEPLVLDVDITGFADADGWPSFGLLSTSVDLKTMDSPTALFDALLNQNGLMTEVVGPSMSLEIHGSELRAESGVLRVDFVGTRATGRMVGRMFDGRFIATEPAELVVSVVRPELGRYLSEAVPAIGTITKTADDGPAVLTVNTLEVPLLRDTQLSRMQGLVVEAVVDIGTARFETSSAFGELMNVAGQRAEGGLGHKIEPIFLTVNSGNLSYPRATIPFGEFTIESEGNFRLTDGYIDIVTFVPMAALSEEALGSLKTGVLSAIGRQFPGFESATMVPWRTRGLPGNRTTMPDVEMLLENVGDAINPLNLIEQGLESVQDLVIDGGGD